MTKRTKMAWVFLIYFAEGLPFGIFGDALPVYFRVHGLSLSEIGAMSLLQMPWSLKVFWGPFVDRVGTPRQWIVAALLSLAVVLAGLAAQDFGGSLVWGPHVALLLLGLAMASATQDIAIDGYFVRFMDADEQGLGNGIRVSAYRAALIVGGGVTVILTAILPWWAILTLAAGLFVALAAAVSQTPSVTRPPPQSWGDWRRSLWQWLQHPGSLGAFAFVLLYKLGDASMASMVKPFWVDRGMSPAEIGLVNTSVGIGMTVTGALLGGWYTSRVGVFRALWVLGLAQAFSNLGYTAVAYFDAGRLALYSASVVENFTGGLGTAAQMALLTRLCDREHAATQFAALTAMFGLTRALAGAGGGTLADTLGFAPFFLLTFVLSVPCYAFLPAVRARLRPA